MSNKAFAHIALTIVSIAYGANYIVAKGLMPNLIGPSGFIFIRVAVATLLFWGLYSLRRQKIDKSDWWRLAVCGLTGVAINQLLFFNGLNLTSPINAVIIMTSNPILVLIASAILLKQRITGKQVSGVLIGLIGAVGLLLLGDDQSGKSSSMLGDLFIFINALSYGIYLVLVKPLMVKYSPVTVVTWVFTFGMIVVLPVGWQQFNAIDWEPFTTGNYVSLIFVVLIVTFLVYLLNIFALRQLPPTTVSAYVYLQPIMTALSAWVASLLGHSDYVDDITLPKIMCAILIFVGVYLVSNMKSKERVIKA